eukprot:6212355-Pleurochrysis_carterae.AAC.2
MSVEFNNDVRTGGNGRTLADYRGNDRTYASVNYAHRDTIARLLSLKIAPDAILQLQTAQMDKFRACLNDT